MSQTSDNQKGTGLLTYNTRPVIDPSSLSQIQQGAPNVSPRGMTTQSNEHTTKPLQGVSFNCNSRLYCQRAVYGWAGNSVMEMKVFCVGEHKRKNCASLKKVSKLIFWIKTSAWLAFFPHDDFSASTWNLQIVLVWLIKYIAVDNGILRIIIQNPFWWWLWDSVSIFPLPLLLYPVK